MTKGKLIVFEGIDKAGKETQAELLKEYLNPIHTKLIGFPNYESESGRLIKRYLLGKEYLSQKTINMVYSVNRYECRSDIEYLLNFGDNVICDRYYYSNMAYGVDPYNSTEDIEEMDSEMPKPDLVIYLDIHPHVSMERKHARQTNDMNEDDVRLLIQARKIYKYLSLNRKEWVQINGEEDKQEVHEQIVAIVENRLFKE